MSIQTNYLDLDLIRIDGGTQSRAHLNQETIKEYADLFSTSHDILPPIRVFFDGKDYWNADGFHRLEAAKQANMKVIAAIIEQGTRRDAILFSVGANAEHGLRRTEDDKHRAVNTLLTDEEWNNWSDNQIAKKCKVSQPFVSKLRKKLNEDTGNVTRTYERNGKTHTMRTNNIGKPKTNQENLELDKNPNPEEMVEDNQTPPESENTTEQSESDTYNVISKKENLAVYEVENRGKILDLRTQEGVIEILAESELRTAKEKILQLEQENYKQKLEIDAFMQCIEGYDEFINNINEASAKLGIDKCEDTPKLTKEKAQFFFKKYRDRFIEAVENGKKANELKEAIDLKDQEIETLKNELQEAKQLNTTLAEEVKKLNETISLKDNEFYKQRKIGELIGANNHQRDNLKKEQERNNKMRRCLIDIEVELETYLENAKKGDGIRINRTNSKKLLEKINQGYSPILHVEQKEGIE